MREYVLVSDSTCDLPIDVIKELDIKILPFSYSINDEVFEYYLDERDGEIFPRQRALCMAGRHGRRHWYGYGADR